VSFPTLSCLCQIASETSSGSTRGFFLLNGDLISTATISISYNQELVKEAQ